MKLPRTKKKTTADVPPKVAAEYGKARRPQAIAEAEGDGYAKTSKMQKGAQQKSQFGLPKSPVKGPAVRLRVELLPDNDKDGM